MREGQKNNSSRREPSVTDRKTLDEVAKRAWLKDGIVILWPERLSDPWDRQHVLNLANSLYGQRRG